MNEMSAGGLALTDYTWCRYVFEDAKKGEYIYRIELLEHPTDHPESRNYIRFMEETGAEFVASYMRWVYFRRRAAEGELNIYSDVESRIKHYGRILILFLVIAGLNFLVGGFNVFAGSLAASSDLPAFNIYFSILSFAMAALLLIFIVVPLTRKIQKLKVEREVHE